MNRSEIIETVKRSSHQYNHPDSVYGYGIPDFSKAMKEILGKLKTTKISFRKHFSISRPAKNSFVITLTEPDFSLDAYRVNLLDESGNLISKYKFEKNH